VDTVSVSGVVVLGVVMVAFAARWFCGEELPLRFFWVGVLIIAGFFGFIRWYLGFSCDNQEGQDSVERD
jgi:hypothetical protein